jgi:hypothetical protein
MKRLRVLVALTLGLALQVRPVHALETTAQVCATWAENLSRTSFGPSQQSAALYTAQVTARQARQLNSDWLLVLSGEAGTELVPRFEGLDSFHGGVHVQLRRKFGLGPLAPVLDFNGGLTGYSVREGGRSGWKTDIGLTLGRRLTDTWRVAATGAWEEYNAAHTAFDVGQRSLALESTWELTANWQLGTGARRLWGQLTANARYDIYDLALDGSFGPAIRDYYNRIPYEVSNTFGPGWVAYRVDCHADLWWVQLAATLGPHTSLPLRYESALVVNRVGVRYRSDFWSLGLVHRF